jgi:hypothetical protein
VGAIVSVTRIRLAVSAKVQIVTDSALVSYAFNVRLAGLALAKWAIAENAKMAGGIVAWLGQRVVDRSEAMLRVDVLDVLDTL